MSTKSNLGNQSFCFVSGVHGGREVFLGRPIDETHTDTITLEGKSIGMTPQGFLVVRPFVTVCTFPMRSVTCQVQKITNPEALAEATGLFTMSVTTISRTSHPLMYRWIETALANSAHGMGSMAPSGYGMSGNGSRASQMASQMGNGGGYNAFNNPFSSFYEGFETSAEQFRRALFQSPQVNTTRELDKLTELEGDLTIEVGKITNQIAIKFNAMLSRNSELTRYFEAIQGFGIPFTTTTTVGGWCFLINRLQIAKNWARRTGKTALVREINTLTKEGINRLNEIILEHCSTLDTLISETFSQYGITFEIWGDLSPFAGYTAPYSGTMESVEHGTMPSYAGAGV
jgi:hypothetical protein